MSKVDFFLKENTHIREELFNHRLFYDLKMAAAEREYHLKIFRATVDFEGYDIIMDDNNKIGRYQIKTKFNSSVKSWNIHRIILFPKNRDAELIPFDNGLCPNESSGVILMEIKTTENILTLKYYYTDFYILKLISIGFIKRNKTTLLKANQILNELAISKDANSKIKICKSLFVPLNDANSLLSICGFDSTLDSCIQEKCMQLIVKRFYKIDEIELKKSNEALINTEALINHLNVTLLALTS